MDIKGAVEVMKACEPVEIENQPQTVKDFRSALNTAIDFLQSYLNLKGFPEEREYPGQPYSQAYETIIPEIKGYNQSLKECKLAVMKMYSKENIYQALLNWEVNIEKANILTKEERLDMLKDLAQAISQIGGEE